MESGEAALREELRKWKVNRKVAPRVSGVDTAPACLHGAMLQTIVDDVRGDLDDIKDELRWIRKMIVTAIGAAGIATILRLAGWIQ